MKPFRPDTNKIENGTSSQEIHNEFMKPFNEKEVVQKFTDCPETERLQTLYSQKLPGNLTFTIYGIKEKNHLTQNIRFSLIEQDPKDKYDVQAVFIFTQETDENDPKKTWEMSHRWVASKNLGISGSDFLAKAEEYFKLLKRNKLAEIDEFQVNVSQPSTIEWLRKNKFDFQNRNTLNPSDFYEYKDGILTLRDPQKYELVRVWHSTRQYMKDEYIVDKGWRTDPEYGEKWQQALKEDSPENIFELYKNGVEDHEIFQMVHKGYIPRFYLEKEL